ncbi:MAG: iron-containing redox enzyme family protein [Candidatus Acidiferrales bacterium]
MQQSAVIAQGRASPGVAGLAPSALLQMKIQLVNPRTLSNTPSVLTHPRLKEFYSDMLFMLYSTIWATVPLLEAACKVSQELAASDAVARGLAPYYETHAAEELHHDEWMLEDMEVLGMDRAEILRRLPPATLAEVVGAQYYWIYHYHPVALLGYLAALETDPVPASVVEKAAAESGVPRAAFRTVLLHAEHDFDHRDELNRLIDRLPLEPHHVKVISESAMRVAAAYDEAFTSILPD